MISALEEGQWRAAWVANLAHRPAISRQVFPCEDRPSGAGDHPKRRVEIIDGDVAVPGGSRPLVETGDAPVQLEGAVEELPAEDGSIEIDRIADVGRGQVNP